MFPFFGARWVQTSAVAAFTIASSYAMAADTGPISNLGVLGSYSKYKLESDVGSDKTHMGKGGVFYNFGNKMTGEEGFIYQGEAKVKFGERHSNKLKEAQGDVDLGWRMAIDNTNYLDALVGGGYGWTRYEPDTSGEDVKLTTKGAFAKAALGYNHQFDEATTFRLEAGARRTLNARARLKVEDVGSDRVDLRDRTNPYAEMSVLFNQGANSMPVMVGVYYVHNEYKLKNNLDVADDVKLKANEYGAKVALAF
ncbi:outer membrane beta-barrel protein [Pseudomonas sp. MAG002Y]|uniref:outer membrane beta-barrel protein n=1 Tax=Pseudomonas TaxID=286 RepID=UPI001C60F712|nr:outer membrane beta-barrel protein [Pseudomonas sp. MAG002Y]MBW5412065.1 outer membrane beta-barrel protein [Pseudomonas sp. MAG002Y]